MNNNSDKSATIQDSSVKNPLIGNLTDPDVHKSMMCHGNLRPRCCNCCCCGIILVSILIGLTAISTTMYFSIRHMINHSNIIYENLHISALHPKFNKSEPLYISGNSTVIIKAQNQLTVETILETVHLNVTLPGDKGIPMTIGTAYMDDNKLTLHSETIINEPLVIITPAVPLSLGLHIIDTYMNAENKYLVPIQLVGYSEIRAIHISATVQIQCWLKLNATQVSIHSLVVNENIDLPVAEQNCNYGISHVSF